MKDAKGLSKEPPLSQMNEAASLMRALSNPARLRLLFELADGERNVGDLEAALGTGQAYVSQQLARLRTDGIVVARRQGRVVYYSISDSRIPSILEVLSSQFVHQA